MVNRDKQVLMKINDHISAVLLYCRDCSTLEDFQNNSMRVEACVFNLMQIGELAKISLSDEAKSEINSIPWNQIYGMRKRIVHGYSGVNMKIVWDTIHEDLSELKDEISRHL